MSKKRETQKKTQQLDTVTVRPPLSGRIFAGGGPIAGRAQASTLTDLPSIEVRPNFEEGQFDERGLNLIDIIDKIPVPRPLKYVPKAASALGESGASNLIDIRKRNRRALEDGENFLVE